MSFHASFFRAAIALRSGQDASLQPERETLCANHRLTSRVSCAGVPFFSETESVSRGSLHLCRGRKPRQATERGPLGQPLQNSFNLNGLKMYNLYKPPKSLGTFCTKRLYSGGFSGFDRFNSDPTRGWVPVSARDLVRKTGVVAETSTRPSRNTM